ncbi:hypothetical protein [Actinophytocola oryzae]|uniref:Uncharacterized protein n=1 Tax=Actinophytocola oryzae TaxID=502181 RepID=A0A4R7VAX6_9PSEU|nr:hypothetical protein [Actinophytocola oryzae]TDV46129.1 hypothetical protein CLV71_11187 [Actinophytocola oryzae]
MVVRSTFDELLDIPRGRGMQAGDVADRVGPGLRTACGVTSADSPATVRRKVAGRLAELCERLPEDLRVSVLAALALHPQANHQFMQDRMGWAARQINRDHPRAAVRRMKIGFRILAEQLDELVSDPNLHAGWHVGSMRALLRLDIDPPHLVEDRVIAASADHLDGIELRYTRSAQHEPVAAGATMLYGGEIIEAEQVTPSHARYAVRLPRTLSSGERHELGVRVAVPPRAIMPPFFVLTPLQPCERFTVRVRFGADVPKRIWRLNGIPPRAIDDFEPADGLLEPDRLGEVGLEFSRLHQGLSYGMRWSAP